MKTANILLDGARLKTGMSDYALAKRLGLARSSISEFRHGKRRMPDWIVIELAQLAQVDDAAALTAHHAEHATQATAETWRRILRRVGPLLLSGALIQPLGQQGINTDRVYYVKQRRSQG